MSESVTTAVPEYLSPAALGEYISYGQCARFAKHRLQEVEGTDSHGPNEFREAFEPLNILFSAAGDEFETDVTSRADEHTRETVDLTDPEDLDDDVFRDNHAAVLQHKLFRRRLLILLSGSYEVEGDKGTAAAVPDTNDSARCVRVGIGRSGPAATGSLA